MVGGRDIYPSLPRDLTLLLLSPFRYQRGPIAPTRMLENITYEMSNSRCRAFTSHLLAPHMLARRNSYGTSEPKQVYNDPVSLTLLPKTTTHSNPLSRPMEKCISLAVAPHTPTYIPHLSITTQ